MNNLEVGVFDPAGERDNDWPRESEYDRIRKNIEETWPDWKIDVANEYMSIHGQKLRKGMQKKAKDHGRVL